MIRVKLLIFLCFPVIIISILYQAGPYLTNLINSVSPPKCKPYFSKEKLLTRLSEQIVGQHIAANYIIPAVSSRFHSSPKHALSLVLAGSTGTGKNLMASLVAESIFGPNAMKTDFVHLFSGRLHFPLTSKTDEYRSNLYSWIKGNVTKCPNSIFIFDEIDKMPPSVLDILKSFLDYHHIVDGVDYRNVTFMFLTNWGDLQINSQYRKLLVSGKNRDEMRYNDFERILKDSLFSEGMLKGAETISSYLINGFIPFLPLERRHVEQCIRNEFSRLAVKSLTQDLVNKIVEELDFKEQYSMSGCKRILHLVNVHVQQQNDLDD